MTILIQLTDENNDPINSLDLGEITESATFKVRVWNNRTNEPGVESLEGLTFNLSYPPKLAVTTMAVNDVFKVRCTFSGEFAEEINESFKDFPIESEDYNRLDSGAYTEYEIKLDFSSLSTEQKSDISNILSEFALYPTWSGTFDGRSKPKEREISSDSSILSEYEITVTSDTEIILAQVLITTSSTARIKVTNKEIETLSDSSVVVAGNDLSMTSDSTIG